MAATPDQELFDSLLRHQVYVQRLASSEALKFRQFLTYMDEDIRDRLVDEELTDIERSRLDRLLAGVDAALATDFETFRQEFLQSLQHIAEHEANFTQAALDAAAPDFETVIPTPDQMRAAIMSAPLSVTGHGRGKLLDALVADWAMAERQSVIGALKRGAFEGKTNAQLVREIRGTKAANFGDGILQQTSNHAERIVRTAIQHVATVAREQTLAANSDIVKEVQWVSTLDKRTCPICRSLDGKRFKNGKGPRPPIHINDRCTVIPVLSGKYSFLNENATRASMEGPVNADMSYYEWLKTQDAEFQDEVLGPTRGKLFRDGGLSAEQFAKLQLDRNFQPLTLDEMRERDSRAFKRADL